MRLIQTINNDEFYPTPATLVKRMLAGIDCMTAGKQTRHGKSERKSFFLAMASLTAGVENLVLTKHIIRWQTSKES